MNYLLSASLAFTVCLCLLPLAASLARKANLVDYPSNRKRHALPTPVVGGVVIFISYPTVLQITPLYCPQWVNDRVASIGCVGWFAG